MLLNVFVYRDKALGCYDAPIFLKDDKEQYAQGIVRACIKASPEDVMNLKDKALYYLGQFDDDKGLFLLLEHEEKLLDLEDYFPRKEPVKEVGEEHVN